MLFVWIPASAGMTLGLRYNTRMKNKALIISYLDIKKNTLIFKNKKSVLVGGCFDLIHYGHLKFLEKAKAQGDFLIVALESDEFIKKNKRKLQVHHQDERAEILSNLNMVDMIVLLPFFQTNNNYFELVKKISPSIIAVTEGDRQLENKKKQAKLIDAEVKEVVTNLKNFSTRNIAKAFDL
ncbi:glycerol-3-phosphate cytidylyltransferase [Candidatus Roizmanbacteria bacterium CG22_combo_CG10-13_8_21_14_all_34_12]|uniref:Glycerol-3-phosphate cytidylyltransferase n=2 Tax=Candidatus Roizmaniibacteriota TaxID=1752723 RepID=A0A2H0C140_9BACT|nr:MAG: glycerol-3-phosphate cytidylyltransferase [Candidatus Roizmanbacteria bacterium CG22_combo_CG10-13_8_21_14_all_34_12]